MAPKPTGKAPSSAAPPKARGQVPTTGAELVAQARMKNRLVALGVVAFATTAFVLVFVAAELNHYRAAEHSGAIVHAATHAAVR